ncbi:hypothetical protein Tco_1194546 [Tanacetum coccineum]
MEVLISGLPRSIEGNVTASKPQTFEEAINIAQRLMDQIIKHDSVQETNDHKRKLKDKGNIINNNNYQNNYNNNNGNNDYHQQQNITQETFGTYAATNGYTGNCPLCERCTLHHIGPYIVKCQTCNRVERKDIMQIGAQKQTTRPQEGVVILLLTEITPNNIAIHNAREVARVVESLKEKRDKPGTDNANILRERSKPDKHGHGKGIECARTGIMLSKSLTSPSALIGQNPQGECHADARKHTKMQDFTLNPSLKKHNGSDTRNATLAIRVLTKVIQRLIIAYNGRAYGTSLAYPCDKLELLKALLSTIAFV